MSYSETQEQTFKKLFDQVHNPEKINLKQYLQLMDILFQEYPQQYTDESIQKELFYKLNEGEQQMKLGKYKHNLQSQEIQDEIKKQQEDPSITLKSFKMILFDLVFVSFNFEEEEKKPFYGQDGDDSCEDIQTNDNNIQNIQFDKQGYRQESNKGKYLPQEVNLKTDIKFTLEMCVPEFLNQLYYIVTNLKGQIQDCDVDDFQVICQEANIQELFDFIIEKNDQNLKKIQISELELLYENYEKQYLEYYKDEEDSQEYRDTVDNQLANIQSTINDQELILDYENIINQFQNLVDQGLNESAGLNRVYHIFQNQNEQLILFDQFLQSFKQLLQSQKDQLQSNKSAQNDLIEKLESYLEQQKQHDQQIQQTEKENFHLHSITGSLQDKINSQAREIQNLKAQNEKLVNIQTNFDNLQKDYKYQDVEIRQKDKKIENLRQQLEQVQSKYDKEREKFENEINELNQSYSQQLQNANEENENHLLSEQEQKERIFQNQKILLSKIDKKSQVQLKLILNENQSLQEQVSQKEQKIQDLLIQHSEEIDIKNIENEDIQIQLNKIMQEKQQIKQKLQNLKAYLDKQNERFNKLHVEKLFSDDYNQDESPQIQIHSNNEAGGDFESNNFEEQEFDRLSYFNRNSYHQTEIQSNIQSIRPSMNMNMGNNLDDQMNLENDLRVSAIPMNKIDSNDFNKNINSNGNNLNDRQTYDGNDSFMDDITKIQGALQKLKQNDLQSEIQNQGIRQSIRATLSKSNLPRNQVSGGLIRPSLALKRYNQTELENQSGGQIKNMCQSVIKQNTNNQANIISPEAITQLRQKVKDNQFLIGKDYFNLKNNGRFLKLQINTNMSAIFSDLGYINIFNGKKKVLQKVHCLLFITQETVQILDPYTFDPLLQTGSTLKLQKLHKFILSENNHYLSIITFKSDTSNNTLQIAFENFKRQELVSFLANIFRAKNKRNLHIAFGAQDTQEEQFIQNLYQDSKQKYIENYYFSLKKIFSFYKLNTAKTKGFLQIQHLKSSNEKIRKKLCSFNNKVVLTNKQQEEWKNVFALLIPELGILYHDIDMINDSNNYNIIPITSQTSILKISKVYDKKQFNFVVTEQNLSFLQKTRKNLLDDENPSDLKMNSSKMDKKNTDIQKEQLLKEEIQQEINPVYVISTVSLENQEFWLKAINEIQEQKFDLEQKKINQEIQNISSVEVVLSQI